MSTERFPSLSPHTSADALVVFVGRSVVAREAAGMLESEGVNTLEVGGGPEALTRVRELPSALVVVNRDDMTGRALLRQPRDGSREALALLVIGEASDSAPNEEHSTSPEHCVPHGLGAADLVERIRSRLSHRRAPTGVPSRPALTEQSLDDEIEKELRLAAASRRPGVLAAVSIAELPRIRSRLGQTAERALAAALDELFVIDAQILEQHSGGPDGGFLLLMPETDLASAYERLQSFARRITSTVIDLTGEHVRITPVIGYAAFDGAHTKEELREQAAVALQDAYLHLDLVPVAFSPTMKLNEPAALAAHDRVLALLERLRSPTQITFTLAVLLSLPFIIYVAAWHAGFDLTTITYPLMAAALAGTATALWLEGFRAVGAVEPPQAPASETPPATAIVAAYLPNEAATIVDTVESILDQDYAGEFQVILAYNSPQQLPIEDTLQALASRDPRLLLLRVQNSTSKAQNINAALAHVRGEFVGIFDADHHPAQGSFTRAWRWLSNDHDIVQGHCVVRNGEASWVARLVAVEFEAIYAVSHPGRARLHGFGIFGGSNGYWRRDTLRQIRMQRSMLTEDIDSSMRSLQDGFKIVSDPGLVSSELAPTTIAALWHQRMRWAQGWTQTSIRHLRPALASERLNARQKVGAAFLLGWAQVVPWITIQVIPILAFTAWRDGGLGRLDWLIPLFVLLSIFTLSAGAFQSVLAYLLGDARIRKHRSWFALYAFHSMLWFGELKNLIARVAQLKELVGERHWRVTPRTVPIAAVTNPGGHAELPEPRGRAR